MAISFTQPIQGPDPNVTGRAFDSLAERIAFAREQERLRDQARAQALFQKQQLEAQQAKWNEEATTARLKEQGDLAKAEAQKMRESREDQIAADERGAKAKDREAAEATRIQGAREKAKQLALAGDREGAESIMRSVGRAPVVDADSQVSDWAASESGAPPQQRPMRFEGGETIDPAAIRGAEESRRQEKIAKVIEAYKTLGSDEGRRKEALELFRRRVAIPDANIDKAADDLGNMIRGVQSDDASEKRSRISAANRPEPIDRNAGRQIYDENGRPIGLAPDAPSAKEARTTLTSVDQAKSIIDELIANYERHGTTLNPTSQAFQDREALTAAYAIAMKDVGKLGVLAGPDMGLIEAGTGNYASRRAGIPLPALKKARQLIDAKSPTMLNRMGVTSTPSVPPPAAARAAEKSADSERAGKVKRGPKSAKAQIDAEAFLNE
jgi:hypothetical protein